MYMINYRVEAESTTSEEYSSFHLFQPATPSKPETDQLDHQLEDQMPSGGGAAMSSDLSSTVKKLNHNASERDRRKKLNSLYSSLRSLLPGTDHTKKLSIPVTVSRVVKYIPELQKQVEKMIERKEEILSSVCSRQAVGDDVHDKSSTTDHHEPYNKKLIRKGSSSAMMSSTCRQSLPTVSANRVDDREVVIQICTLKVDKRTLLSEVLLNLESEDFRILNASAFDSNGDRVFYNLHLQVKDNRRLECEMLSEKLLSLCGREFFFP